MPGGQPVHRYSLHSEALRVQLSDYGARLLRVQTPDRLGQWGDLLLGHPDLATYLHHPQATYYGAVIGRFGNRIAAGRFALDGQTYQLATNDGPNALHGGPGGFHAVRWDAKLNANTLDLHYTSPDGEEGYPGDLDVSARYTLSHDTLRLTLRAECRGRATILNLTHHPFWNLLGQAGSGDLGDVLGHELTLNADALTAIDTTMIPTGELASVVGTPFDFRTPHAIGERIGAEDQQLRNALGYDHNFVLEGEPGQLRPNAVLHNPSSGRRLELSSTQPGLQVYSGNFNDGSLVGFGGQRYGYRSSVCLEPQHFPDSPNQPNFPSTVLRPR